MPKRAARKQRKKSPKLSSGSNWIQGAIKHKGALHKDLHVKPGKKIPKKKLDKALVTKGKVGYQARLAKTLDRLRKK